MKTLEINKEDVEPIWLPIRNWTEYRVENLVWDQDFDYNLIHTVYENLTHQNQVYRLTFLGCWIEVLRQINENFRNK